MLVFTTCRCRSHPGLTSQVGEAVAVGDPEAGHTHLPNLRGQGDLPHLLAEVQRTRTARHEAQRLMGPSVVAVLPARRASLNALETYSRELDRNGWPVPRQMLLEIRLLQSLCGRTMTRP